MATILRQQNILVNQKSYTQNRSDFRRFIHPRLCMVISIALIVVGISLPILMVFDVMPSNLILDFLGFGMVSLGSTLTLIHCGEV